MNGNEEQRAEALARRFLGGDLSRRSFLRRAGGFWSRRALARAIVCVARAENLYGVGVARRRGAETLALTRSLDQL